MDTVINWFELPVLELDRAVDFYQYVFGVALRREKVMDIDMAIFPYNKPATGGALVKGTLFAPAASGTVIYLATEDITAALERVREKGGVCSFGPHVLPHNIGTIALIIDTEGNRVGLHQPA